MSEAGENACLALAEWQTEVIRTISQQHTQCDYLNMAQQRSSMALLEIFRPQGLVVRIAATLCL